MVQEVNGCIESDLTGNTGPVPDDSAELSVCVDRLQSIAGVLRAMEYNEFALYADEIHALYRLSITLDPVNDADVLNDFRELLYLVIIDFPALLEGVLSGQILDWHEYSGMFNRMRKARHRGLIFNSDTLMKRQETDFRAIFNRDRERYTQILQRHIDHYRDARKLLMKSRDMARGLDAMHRVFSGLAVVCRDYRLSTLWSLCAALSEALPDNARSHENEIVRLLCSFSSILDAVCTRGMRAQDQNIPEDILEKVLDAFTRPLVETGPVLAVRQWFNLDLGMTRQQRQKHRSLVVGYSGKEALIKAMGLLNEQITRLLDTINEITADDEASPVFSEEQRTAVYQIRCTLQALNMTPEVGMLDAVLNGADEEPDSDHKVRMDRFARALYNCELALKARQEALERAVFASTTVHEEARTLTGARMAIIIEVLRNLERVVISINHYVDGDLETDRLREAIPLLDEARTALTTVPEKWAAEWCAAAGDYVHRTVGRSDQVSLDEGFHAFAHLVINTILYLEQLGIGRFGDMSAVQRENDRLAELVADVRQSEAGQAETAEQDDPADPSGLDRAQFPANETDTVVVPFPASVDSIGEPANADETAPDPLFIREAERQVDTIRSLLERSNAADISTGDFQIAIHTLHGSCRVSGEAALAALVGRLERALQENPGFPERAGFIQVLEAFCSIAERYLLDLARGEGRRDLTLDADVQLFLHDLTIPAADRSLHRDHAQSLLTEGFLREVRPVHADLVAVLGACTSRGEVTAADAESIRRLAEQIEGAAEVAGENELAGLCHTLATMGESLSKEECQGADGGLMAATRRCREALDSVMAGLDGEASSAAADNASMAITCLNEALEKAKSAQHERHRLEAEKGDEDDLHRIFEDEASELLQILDTALADWQQSPEDTGIVDDIARQLHTLKGSAALVGLSGMSQTAHDFETLLLASRHATETKEVAFFSRFETLLERLQGQFASFRGHDLLTHGYTAQTEVATEAPAEAAVEVTAEAPTEAPTEATTEVAVEVTAEAPSEASTEAPSEAPAEAPAETLMEAHTEGLTPGENRPDKTGMAASLPIDEQVRVSANLLQKLLNDADEIDVTSNRFELALSESRSMMNDMQETLGRLNTYLQRFEQQARPALSRSTFGNGPAHADDFDVLEMERYTELQQLWLSLREDYDDLHEIRSNILNQMRSMENILTDQQRITHKLQDGLVSSQMVPFSSIVPRLRRLVRQVAQELEKSVSVRFSNPEGKIDRSMLQTIVGPIEHMIRNAIDHGVERGDERKVLGKPDHSELVVKLSRQGASILLDISDDGRGIDPEKVRNKALQDGLVSPEEELSDQAICQLILRAGFSTSERVSRFSGRGVGLDVVQEEIQQIGGELEMISRKGIGTTFRIRLPLSSSLNRALLFRLQGRDYVMLLNTIDGILMEKSATLRKAYHDQENAQFEYAGEHYELAYLGTLLDTRTEMADDTVLNDTAPLLLISGQDRRIALHVDSIVGTRELIVRSLGAQFATVAPVSGGVIMGDGRVVIVLDPITLVDHSVTGHLAAADRMFGRTREASVEDNSARTVLVVDDSITVRKVTSAILQRNGMKVLLARDGMEAIEILQNTLPDMMLLDIEMPRMDGFEVATWIRRQNSAVRDMPIIMITSRIGDKHRTRAEEIGVNQYMCKPFQEDNLLQVMAGCQ